MISHLFIDDTFFFVFNHMSESNLETPKISWIHHKNHNFSKYIFPSFQSLNSQNHAHKLSIRTFSEFREKNTISSKIYHQFCFYLRLKSSSGLKWIWEIICLMEKMQILMCFYVSLCMCMCEHEYSSSSSSSSQWKCVEWIQEEASLMNLNSNYGPLWVRLSR